MMLQRPPSLPSFPTPKQPPRPPIQPPAGHHGKKIIVWDPSRLTETIAEVEKEMIERGAEVYLSGRRIVQPVSSKATAAPIWRAQGQEPPQQTTAWEIHELNAGSMSREINKYIAFHSDGKTTKPISAPRELLAAMMHPHPNETLFQPLQGISCVPYLYSDGSYSLPGYNEDLHIDFRTHDLDVTQWVDEPTFADAQQALINLCELIAEFPFAGPVDRGVALVAFLTACARRGVQTSPLIGFSAPIRGSGKSILTDMIAIVSTGTKAKIITYGSSQEEFDKRIDAALLSGTPLISFDNLEPGQPLRSTSLCSYLTGGNISVRIMGSNRHQAAVPATQFFVNGNNLVVWDDLDRRTILANIDPRVERPELEPHTFNPIKRCFETRSEIVRDVFTILRAYIFAGNPFGIQYNLGSFEEWAEHVVSPLLWAAQGCEDLIGNPLTSVEKVRKSNPVQAFELEFKRVWHAQFGDSPIHVKELLAPNLKDKPIFQALRDLTGDRHGEISSRSLGRKLPGIKDRVHSGYRLVEHDDYGGSKRWRVILEE